MSRYLSGWKRCLSVAALAGLGALGCGKKEEAPAPAAEAKSPAPARQVETASAETKAPAPTPAETPAKAAGRDRLHQTFADATFGAENPPADVKPPVDKTLTGKSGVSLCEQVAKAWDGVKFSDGGKKIDYVVTLHTNQGELELAVLPELAPNHARNFVVLAKLGYYDGLRFDRVHYEKDGAGNLSHCIEAGCPLGNGTSGGGSIGYWLKDEFTPAAACTHVEGVVGAFRMPDANSAATKFYVNMHASPFRDGHYSLFAKVVGGLDVAKKISNVEGTADPEDGSRTLPTEPVVIEKVTVRESAAK